MDKGLAQTVALKWGNAHGVKCLTDDRGAKKERSDYSTGVLMRRAKSRIQGHLNYYAITDNGRMCESYRNWFTMITYKWLNRRSQRKKL